MGGSEYLHVLGHVDQSAIHVVHLEVVHGVALADLFAVPCAVHDGDIPSVDHDAAAVATSD